MKCGIARLTLPAVALTTLILSHLSFAQPPLPASSPEPGPAPVSGQQQTFNAIEKVAPGVFRLGDILIRRKERSITFPAMVNMEQGLLEYLLVRNSGKTHESLLRTGVDPYSLQVACLLAGLETSDTHPAFQGDPAPPKGEPVVITIRYDRNAGQSVAFEPEAWIVKMAEERPQEVGALKWVHTGSAVIDDRFLAQIEGSIIALYHDPAAIINNASPGGESDRIWFVKEGAVPPAGTPVTVTIKAKD